MCALCWCRAVAGCGCRVLLAKGFLHLRSLVLLQGTAFSVRCALRSLGGGAAARGCCEMSMAVGVGP